MERNGYRESLLNDESEQDKQNLSKGKFCGTRLRLRTVLFATLVSSILSFNLGSSLTFSSPALLELTQLQNPSFRFDTTLTNIFGVSLII